MRVSHEQQGTKERERTTVVATNTTPMMTAESRDAFWPMPRLLKMLGA